MTKPVTFLLFCSIIYQFNYFTPKSNKKNHFYRCLYNSGVWTLHTFSEVDSYREFILDKLPIFILQFICWLVLKT